VLTGTRDERVGRALTDVGASVLSGITLTKLIGVSVLAFSRSEIFVVYYFRSGAASRSTPRVWRGEYVLRGCTTVVLFRLAQRARPYLGCPAPSPSE